MSEGGCAARNSSAQGPVEGRRFTLASGRVVRLLEVREEAGAEGAVARFRFVAENGLPARPGLTDDLERLCREVVVPWMAGRADRPARVILSVADRALPFGEIDREAVQYFEAFRIADGDCLWEP